MWKLRRIAVQNFLGFRDFQEYEVQNGKAVLIQGINNTDAGTESNGAGKTSFQEIVHYCYLGTGSRKDVTDKGLIHYGEDQAYLSNEFLNSKSGAVLKVERTINQKSSSTLTITLNGEDQRNKFPTIPEGNKYLLQLIGISQKDFQSYYLINDEKYKPFFNSSDSEKKDFIGRFSKADSVLPALDSVEKDIAKKDKEIKEKEADILVLVGRLQTYEESLAELKLVDYKEKEEKLREENKTALQELKDSIDEDSASLKEIQPLQDLIRKRVSTIEYRLSSLEKLSYKSLTAKVEKEQSEVLSEKRKIEQAQKEASEETTYYRTELSGILVELSEVITCPKCKHTFSLKKSTVDKKELEVLKSEVENEIEALGRLVEEKKVLTKEKQLQLQLFLDKLGEFNKKEGRLRGLISLLQTEQKRLNRENLSQGNEEETLKASIQKYKSLLEVEEKFSIKNEIAKVKAQNKEKEKEIKEKQRSQEEALKVLEISVDQLKSERLEVSKWIINFKRFYTVLVNKSLLVIQGHANNFLQKMGTDLQLQLEGYKTLASGEVREKISSNLLRNGIREGGTGNGSKGERKRLECALIVANQTIINSSSETGGLDLLFLDEVLDGIDGTGMQTLIDSLSSLGKTIFLTTHIVPKYMPETVLVIEKTKGVSRIIPV